MITVLLTTYNSAPFLRDQLNSLLAQEYNDWKVLARDDGSSDDTIQILEEYIEKHPDRFSLIKGESSSGSAQGNFFELLLRAEDDYIMLCDHDDFWMPEKMEMTLSKMQTAEEELGKETPILIHSDLFVAGSNLHMLHASFADYQKLSPEKTDLKSLLVQNQITGCTVMINRALLSLVREKPKSALMHDWWLGLLAASFGEIRYLHYPLILYRQHSANQVGAKDAHSANFYKSKIKNGSRSREVIKGTILQAEEFLQKYGEWLPEDKKSLVKLYASLKNKNKISRIFLVLKYKFFKNTFLRTVGFLYYI